MGIRHREPEALSPSHYHGLAGTERRKINIVVHYVTAGTHSRNVSLVDFAIAQAR